MTSGLFTSSFAEGNQAALAYSIADLTMVSYGISFVLVGGVGAGLPNMRRLLKKKLF